MTPHHNTHLHEHGLATLRRDPHHEGQCPDGAKNKMAAGTGAQQVRCHPAEPGRPDPRVPLVQEVCRLIDAHPDEPARLATLATRVRTTPHRLLRAFRGVLGISPRQYHDARRIDQIGRAHV